MDEREEFEAWAVTDDGNCSEAYGDLAKGEDGVYINYLVERDWEVWQARAALAATQAGSKLVPVEPTPAMLDVAVSFALNVQISRNYNWSAYMADVYRRMVSAAP